MEGAKYWYLTMRRGGRHGESLGHTRKINGLRQETLLENTLQIVTGR
jgi:hypothetical protein